MNKTTPIILSALALGFSTLITQVIVLREFLTVFEGNELVMGIILSNWMLLTGIGSYLGRWSVRIRKYDTWLIGFLILMAVLPLAMIWTVNSFRHTFLLPGIALNLSEIALFSGLILLPFCLLTGFIFTFLVNRANKIYQKSRLGNLYALEAIGSLAGGILFNAILIFWLSTLQSLMVLMGVNFFVGILQAFHIKKKGLAFFLTGIAIILISFFMKINPDRKMKQELYPGQEIILSEDTPYGNLVITQSGNQQNFYENGVLLFSTADPVWSEEAVHYPLLQLEQAQTVLLVSGGISGAIDELLKYENLQKIDYVELNPWIIKLGKRFTQSLQSPKVNVIVNDARLFLKKTHKTYDAILINLPEPSTAQINRFYTLEFFDLAKQHVSPDGILSLSLPASGNYMSNESLRLNSVIYNTLKKKFENICIVPGNRNYFLASKDSLSLNIATKIKKRGISNRYVNQYYIDDELLKQRSKLLKESFYDSERINRDFKPAAYFEQMQIWINKMGLDKRILLAIGGVVVILLIVLLNPLNIGLFTAGFAGASVEFLLLIGFQVIYGYVYQMTGIIITLFMAGLVLGAMIIPIYHNKISIRQYILLQLLTGAYVMALPFILKALKNYNIHVIAVNVAFAFLTLIMATLVGYLFHQASFLPVKKHHTLIAAENYAADSIGSAIGALIIAVLLLPLTGIVQAGLFIGLLCWISAAVLWLRKSTA